MEDEMIPIRFNYGNDDEILSVFKKMGERTIVQQTDGGVNLKDDNEDEYEIKMKDLKTLQLMISSMKSKFLKKKKWKKKWRKDGMKL